MRSEPANAEVWNRFADSGRAVLTSAAVLAPLWRRDTRTSFNALTAILATDAVAKALKAVWDEPRPDGENDKSFPSQHAGDCFAAAMTLDRKWPNAAGPYAIGIATAVSMARVFSGKHHVADVIAGASVGILAAEMVASLAPYDRE